MSAPRDSSQSQTSDPTERPAKRVLLIGWDAADWKMVKPLIEKGHMPNLKRFVDEGVTGNIASLQPMLSPILWTSIATGKHADKHQILGFAEPDGTTGKIRPVTSTSRRCRAVWNILSERGLRCGVVNWFASHPAERINGFVVTDRYPHAVGPPDKEWPAVERSVHPAELLEEACEMRVHPAETTPQQVAPFMPRLGEVDPEKDTHLHELRVELARCATVHAVAAWLMEDEPWDFMGVYYDAIDRFGHSFMEFHPPRMEHVSEADFERYKDVMTGCYRFHDMMLGRLMDLAGPETTVIITSDHGFHSDHLRPAGTSAIKDGQPVAWHRPYGLLAIMGPGIRNGEPVYGASLLDLAPTVLTMLGCPVAEDMDGKALTQVFEEPPAVETVPTYEREGAPPHDAGTDEGEGDEEDDPWVAQKMLEQMAALGYMDKDAAAEGVVIDRARNLGQVYAATGRPERAIEQFEEVLAKKPDDAGARMAVASCLLQLGRLDECETIAMEVLCAREDAPKANLFLGMIAFRRDDPERALEHLRAAEAQSPDMPDLQVQIGNVLLRRERWEEAKAAFERAIEIDGDSAEALDGLGVTHRQLKQPQLAVLAHMQSIALLHSRPRTHINLGLALAECGRVPWAIEAFNVAIEQNPQNPFPHHCLAELYERAVRNTEKAAEHRRKAKELREAMGAAANGGANGGGGG